MKFFGFSELIFFLAFFLFFITTLSGCNKTTGPSEQVKLTGDGKVGVEIPYPHPAKWYLPEVHGLAAANKSAQCLLCHGSDQGNSSKITCAQCHSIYPHPDDFVSGHMQPMGNSLASKSDVSCTSCHTDLTKHTKPESKCSNCHGDQELRLRWSEKAPLESKSKGNSKSKLKRTSIDHKK